MIAKYKAAYLTVLLLLIFNISAQCTAATEFQTYRVFQNPKAISAGITTAKDYALILGVSNTTSLFSKKFGTLWQDTNGKLDVFAVAISIIFLILIFILIMIIQIKRKQEELLRRISTIDMLTGIRNLPKFKADAAEIIRKYPNNHYAILYINLKNFKYINDKFGYDSGDEVLKIMAEKIQENLQPNEVCGHVFADIFAVLCSFNDSNELAQRFCQISKSLSQVSFAKEPYFEMKACSGIYCIDDDIDKISIDMMIDRAILAQKSIQKNSEVHYAFYRDEMRSRMTKEQEMEARMVSALKNHEFIVYLQPKYHINSKKATCAEALIRWIDPNSGMLLPREFIPLFEKDKFIIKLDEYVFEECCRLIRQWLDEDTYALPISVNVSGVQFNSINFIENYKRIKDKYKIPDGYLELEFTESIVFKDSKRLEDVALELKKSGFLCSIDDFGTGYSALNILTDLSVDVLKLDSQFFKHKNSSDRDKIVIKSIVSMAKALNMATVAEGIENWEQVKFLEEIGCDFIQGFAYARPMPIEEFNKNYITVRVNH